LGIQRFMIVFSDDDESNKLDLKLKEYDEHIHKLVYEINDGMLNDELKEDNYIASGILFIKTLRIKIRDYSIQNRFIIAFMNDLNTQIPVGTNHKYYYELILLLLSMQNIWNSINYQVEEMK
ncbi:3534_t:CDS:2, partial [Entrophospora sp. SA101]